jgi:uncharacterized membrane protein
MTDYTNTRRAEAKRAKKIEREATSKVVQPVLQTVREVFPAFTQKDVVFIQFNRERRDVDALASSLGLVGSSPSEVGIAAFEYTLRREVI